MKLLEHASACRDPHCGSNNCHKIKEMFAHAHSCRVKVMGGCSLCRCASLLLGAVFAVLSCDIFNIDAASAA